LAAGLFCALRPRGRSGVMANTLAEPVTRFVTDVTETIEVLARSVGRTPGPLTDDVALEAWHVASAFVDADGTHTDDELRALIDVFGHRIELLMTVQDGKDLRHRGLVDGSRGWIATPSPLFSLLVDADRKNGTMNAWRYYDSAMAIAHATCALDTLTTQGELQALEQFRVTLLRAMEDGGLRNPWTGRSPLSGRIVGAAVPAGPQLGSAVAAIASAPPGTPARPIEELLSELTAMIGLAEVKTQVRVVTNLIRVQQMRRERHLPVPETSHHLVFTGNPGTGKTTVARLVAQIYRSLGVVDKGQLVESGRNDLVAGYMGQTALKTAEVFTSATGGVLLIDEAYALSQGQDGDFGQEAIDTLVKLMEDHRGQVVVIVAGYPEEMAEFLDANPGLRSRFPRTIHFPDYSTDELLAIFDSLCHESSYTLTAPGRDRLRAILDAEPRVKGFGNGRLARNLFEAAIGRQAGRIVAMTEPTDEDLCRLTPEDLTEPA
jgi:hypothetical protein